MSYSVKDLRASVANLLTKNNTTTSSYDISTSLANRVTEVIAGYRRVGEIAINYPIIWVELKSDSEEFSNIGKSSSRYITVRFDVVAETSYGMGNYDGGQLADSEMIILAQNIKNVFRAFPNLSSTALKVDMVGTTYDESQGVGDTWNSSARISLEVYKLIS